MGGGCARSGLAKILRRKVLYYSFSLNTYSADITSLKINILVRRAGNKADGLKKSVWPTLTRPHKSGTARVYTASPSLFTFLDPRSLRARSYGRRIMAEWTFSSIAHACTHPQYSEGVGSCNNMRRGSSVSPKNPSAHGGASPSVARYVRLTARSRTLPRRWCLVQGHRGSQISSKLCFLQIVYLFTELETGVFLPPTKPTMC